MGMLVNWYLEGRAVQVYAWGELTIEELARGAEETRQLLGRGAMFTILSICAT